MLEKFKNFFSRGRHGADEKGHRPKSTHGVAGKATAKKQTTVASKASAKTSAPKSVAHMDLSKVKGVEAYKHISQLRAVLARSRAELSAGDVAQVKQARAMRKQLAQARAQITQVQRSS